MTEFAIQTHEPSAIQIMSREGNLILKFAYDGTVTGEAKDASEAAKIFCEHVALWFKERNGTKAQADTITALRQRVEALEGALRLIYRNETEVFDDELQENVFVSMDVEEMQDIAKSALEQTT